LELAGIMVDLILWASAMEGYENFGAAALPLFMLAVRLHSDILQVLQGKVQNHLESEVNFT